jgi:hypothetical protein
MTLPDFITALESELRPRPVVYDRRELETWATAVWPIAEEDPNPGRWAEAFLEARGEAVRDRA